MRRPASTPLAFACLCALVLLAGCVAPTAQPAAEPGEDTGITVENGSYAVDHEQLFDRLQTLKGTDVEPPKTVRASVPEGGTPASAGGLPAFADAVGFERGPVETSADIGTGYVTGLGTVVAAPPENATRDDERLLLAHELTHYVQLRNDRPEQLGGELDSRTTDGAFVQRAIVEGAAVYTTDAYLDRYGETDTRNSPVYDDVLATLPPGHELRYGLAQYRYGTVYVADRVDSPAELSAVYADPPTTSRQVIHGLNPDEAEPATLDIAVETGGDWREVGTDRMGEAFLRYALESELDADRAATIAAGWRWDSLRIVESDGGAGASYAWVHRWDDADAADAFVDAMGTYLDGRASTTDRGVATEHRWQLPDGTNAAIAAVSPEATVLLFGSDTFLDAAELTGTDDEVTVTLAPAD